MRPRHLLSLILVLLIGYPLSVGPAAFWLIRVQKVHDARWFHVVYYPLEVASDHSRWVQDAFEKYGELLGLGDE